MLNLASITLESPSGGAWEFLALFVVVILGPPLVRMARIPGIIGLLVGGFLIGPNGFGLLDPGSTTIPDLGQLGLLYLMFIAGVELDLSLLRRHRKSATTFGLLTFAFPMAFGVMVGAGLGWELPASLLLGSLLASHTLLLYPLAKDAGLNNDPVVASVVGATVLTDTIALVILAVVAGTQSGTGSTSDVILELGLGFLSLGLVCFVALPFLARRAFRFLGQERTVRYAIAIASFLIAAVVAETFGIEGIVGAFFAGLAINRLVPTEGPLMNRIDFFGGAVFIPVFLVSVGLLLKPAVMFEGETIGLAALLIVACLGGKYIAGQLTRLILKATGPQANLAFALSAPQAAATLAATTVGFNIGLFGESVVNAVLVLILVSVLVATIVAERAKSRIELPEELTPELGERVLVAIANLEGAQLGLRLARSVARREAGKVEVLLLAGEDSPPRQRRAELDRLSGTCRRLGIDADPLIRITDNTARTTLFAAHDFNASLVLAVTDPGQEEWVRSVGLKVSCPIAVVLGDVDAPLGEVVKGEGPDASGLVTDFGDAVESNHRSSDHATVRIRVLDGWSDLPGQAPPEGTGMVLLHPGPASVDPDEAWQEPTRMGSALT